MKRDLRFGPGPGGICGGQPSSVDAAKEMAEKLMAHLGGPDDNHYAKLGIQPIEVTEAWSKHWPAGVAYHLGEAIAAIARCGTKGQAVRDLKKAAWLCTRAAECLEKAETAPARPKACLCAAGQNEWCRECLDRY